MYGQAAHDVHSTLACPSCPAGSQTQGEGTSACQMEPLHPGRRPNPATNSHILIEVNVREV